MLKFTPEEITSGAFNLFDHLGELMSPRESDINCITPIHGMGNTHQDAINLAQEIRDQTPEGTLLLGHYSECNNFFTDALRVVMEFLGVQTLRVKMTGELVNPSLNLRTSIFREHASNSLIIVKEVLSSKEGSNQELHEKRAIIHKVCLSLGLGGAKPMSKKLIKDSRDFYSEGDYITKWFAFRYLKNPNYEIHIIPAISKWHEKTAHLIDHAALGSTYKGAIENTFNKRRHKDIDFMMVKIVSIVAFITLLLILKMSQAHGSDEPEYIRHASEVHKAFIKEMEE